MQKQKKKEKTAADMKNTIVKLLVGNPKSSANYRAAAKIAVQLRAPERAKKKEEQADAQESA